MKYYEFSQNNSGGSFDVDQYVCHRLFIEADNAEEAISKAEDLGCYFDGVAGGSDCPCCGDRWYAPWSNDGMTFPHEYIKADKKNGTPAVVFDTVEDYAQHLADEYGWTSPDARIFKKDGTVIEVYSGKVKGKR